MEANATRRVWTIEEAQVVLAEVAEGLRAIGERLDQVYWGVLTPLDHDERLAYRKSYDVATELVATIEGGRADLKPLIESFERLARVTDEELEGDFRRTQEKRYERT